MVKHQRFESGGQSNPMFHGFVILLVLVMVILGGCANDTAVAHDHELPHARDPGVIRGDRGFLRGDAGGPTRRRR